MNPNQITTMLQLQDTLNRRVNPDWLNAGYAWHRAILVEAAEAMDHWGYKWWKKQEANLPAVQMELVDIWHFTMSMMIEQAKGDLESVRDEIMLATSGSVVIHFADKVIETGKLDFRECLDAFAGMAALKEPDVSLFDRLLQHANLDWNEVFRQYVAKNVLNLFRQDHGYKEGSYRKNWGGEEDNDALVRAMNALDAQSPTFAKDLRQALEARYAELFGKQEKDLVPDGQQNHGERVALPAQDLPTPLDIKHINHRERVLSLPDEIVVVCQKNGSDVGNFTDGKAYPANRENGVVFQVLDDRGIVRSIIPDEHCPHLVKKIKSAYTGGSPGQVSVGKFATADTLLLDLADRIEPACILLRDTLLGDDPRAQDLTELAHAINEMIIENWRMVAKATGNSLDKLACFKPKDEITPYFGVDADKFLRMAAIYRSFNEELWNPKFSSLNKPLPAWAANDRKSRGLRP